MLLQKIVMILIAISTLSIMAQNLKGQNSLTKGVEEYRLLVKFEPDVQADIENSRVAFFGEQQKERSSELSSLLSSLQFRQIFDYTQNEKRTIRSNTRSTVPTGQFDKAAFSGLLTLIGSEKMDKEELLFLANKLESFDIVEYCALEAVTPPPPPSMETPPSTPDFTNYQYYKKYDHGNDTIGINIEYAWSIGITGEGVKVADIEWGMDYEHEDLQSPRFIEALKTTNNEHDDHGTAVAGVLIAKDNGFGMKGMVHNVDKFYGFSEITQGRTAAIAKAIDSMDAGDVIIYEMQTGGKGSEFVPADYNQAVWDLTKSATDAGIIVVAAAGNGSQNLDDPFYKSYNDRGDNGSIIVGAGTIKGQNRVGFSTYGNRVDLQGWGDWSVATTGYGHLHNGGPHATYTKSFSGTSSATPIVASAVVAVQSYAKTELTKTLTPQEMRTLLKETGTPQGTGGHIGPLPNVEAAIKKLGTPVIDSFTLTITNGTGTGKYAEGSSVTVVAESKGAFSPFSHWSGDVAFLDDSTKVEATIIIPNQNVTLIAIYKSSKPFVTVVTPNGGEVYESRDTITIRWESNLEGMVTLSLLTKEGVKKDLLELDVLTESYRWAADTDVIPNKEYAIILTSDKHRVADTSNAFFSTRTLTKLPVDKIVEVTASSKYSLDYSAKMSIDKDPITFWHNATDGTDDLPSEIIYKLDTPYRLTGISYLPRQDESVDSKVKEYEIWLSSDNVEWISFINGEWADNSDKKVVEFPENKIEAQYLRVKMNSSTNGKNKVSIAELNLYYDESAVAITTTDQSRVSPTMTMLANQKISITIPQKGFYTVTMYALNGRVIQQQKLSLKQGVNQVTLSPLATSLHIIELKGNGITKRVKALIK